MTKVMTEKEKEDWREFWENSEKVDAAAKAKEEKEEKDGE